MTAQTCTWLDIGPLDAIPVRGARIIKTKHGCVAVFRSSENEAFALDDRCPHKGGPLSQGIVHGTSVTCPMHNWVIDLNSGEAQGADTGSVKTYPLKIDNGRVFVDLASLGARHAA